MSDHMTPEARTMREGDPVWYRQIQRGGYGYPTTVPAVFVVAHMSRVTIRVFLKDGTQKQIVVHPNNVRPRNPEAVWK